MLQCYGVNSCNRYLDRGRFREVQQLWRFIERRAAEPLYEQLVDNPAVNFELCQLNGFGNTIAFRGKLWVLFRFARGGDNTFP